MFNFLRRKTITLSKHIHKNLSIELPSKWLFELEDGEQEVCYDPNSSSSLRINILKATAPDEITREDATKTLTNDEPYVITPNELFLTDGVYSDFVEQRQRLTLITWKLIKLDLDTGSTIAVFSYTLLTDKLNSSEEQRAIDLIRNSLYDATIV